MIKKIIYPIFHNHLITFNYCLNKILHYMYVVIYYRILVIGFSMNENISQQFKFFGLNAINFSIVFSIFLVTWGIAVSFISGSNSVTSMIPTFLGIPIFILSLLSKLFPKSQKMLMHIVIPFGLITTIGGADFFRGLIMGNLMNNAWADLSKLMMFIAGLLFCYVCIQHFRFIRKMKANI